MKAVLLATLALAPLISSAAAVVCPNGSAEQAVCTSTPKAGDQDVAAQVFDQITICGDLKKAYLVFEKNGQSDSAQAKVIARLGATTYSVTADDVEYSLSRIITPEDNANFYVTFKGQNLSAKSTYTCK